MSALLHLSVRLTSKVKWFILAGIHRKERQPKRFNNATSRTVNRKQAVIVSDVRAFETACTVQLCAAGTLSLRELTRLTALLKCNMTAIC